MTIHSKLINYVKNRLGWLKMLLFFKTELNYINTKLDINDKKVVALIPHADDELIGMGTLLSNTNMVKLIYFEFLGSDYSDTNKKIRQNEFEKYCKHLGVQFSFYSSDAKKGILGADVVLLPSIVDWHDEHIKLNYILRGLCENQGSHPFVGWYNISVYSSISNGVRYVKENKTELKRKYKDLKSYYSSQKNLPILRFKIKDRLYGREIGEYSAEKYIYLDYSKWLEAVNRFEDSSYLDDLLEIKRNLNNFKTVDFISSKIYNEILG